MSQVVGQLTDDDHNALRSSMMAYQLSESKNVW